jgi:hypothetical protein
MLVITTTVRLYDISFHAYVKTMGILLTWSTGFIATPRVFGHELRFTANLCFARDASGENISPGEMYINCHLLSIGLSVRPPPATMPTMPRTLLLTTFFAPLGSLTRVFPSSGLCPMTVT